MKIVEVVSPLQVGETFVQVWSRTGGKMVRKYRCTAGVRKGRIVSDPKNSTAPKRMSGIISIKRAKARKGSALKVKRARTKRATFSRRISKLNRLGHQTVRGRTSFRTATRPSIWKRASIR